MNEMMQEMTKQTEQQIAQYQMMSVIGFVLVLIHVVLLAMVAWGIFRIAFALEKSNGNANCGSSDSLDDAKKRLRVPPFRSAPELPDTEVAKWLNSRKS